MHVGITFDLRADYLAMGYGEQETAEFDRGETIDAIAAALTQLGHEVDRIGHARKLMARLTADEHWELVFNIAEGLRGYGREAQVPAILDVFNIPYTFADPLSASLTLHKAMTKRVLRDAGVPTTDFRLVADEGDLAAVNLPFPLFVKPVAEGTAKGIDARSRADSAGALREICLELIARFEQPALVEPFLAGREFTVGIVGTGRRARAVGTLEIELLAGAEPHAYTYVNKEKCEELCRYRLADAPWAARCELIALHAWQALDCRDGGRVDLRADAAGSLFVMELNPLPGLHPEHSDLPIICTAVGMPYVELIREIVASARLRTPARDKSRR
ncbi:MAG: D-alanine--D-alanine ligase [Phycisphaerae bacterium]|nr:D-alanine--D-alanine ligase [Phycisphaerae bacterium]